MGQSPKLYKRQLWFLCFPRRLLLLNNCMKFQQDLLNCFQDTVPKRYCRKLLFYMVQRDITKTYKEELLFLCCQDRDQDSLLVKRRNDNHSPGPVIRELVPSSRQKSELSNTILCIFSGWDQRIAEGIPIPDSLGEEATFINICFGNGSLKCHRVLISTTPSFKDKVIFWYTGFTFKTFI